MINSNDRVYWLSEELGRRDHEINKLRARVSEKDQEIGGLKFELARADAKNVALRHEVEQLKKGRAA